MSPLLLLLALTPAASASTLEGLWGAGAAAFDRAAVHAAAPGLGRRSVTQPPLRLSELARTLAQDPTAVDDLLDIIVANAGLLGRRMDSPERRAELKEALRNADASVLDAFPTLSPAKLAEAAAFYASQKGPNAEPQRPAVLTFALPGAPAAPAAGQYLRPLGHGLHYGDESLAVAGTVWGDAKAVSAALNQLGAGLPIDDAGVRYGSLAGWLGALLAAGHTLEVRDTRLYANFGDLRYDAGAGRRDVATPTWADTGVVLPSGRKLVVPITHSELDISIRGPRVNVELSWFFGVDGIAAFRPYDTQDQSWVGGRAVARWTGAAAARLLDKAGDVGRALDVMAKAASLPMGGYGPLGGCNDANAFVTGVAPYGMLRDPRRFAGGGPLDAVSNALPYDVVNPSDARRVWESRAFEDPADIPLPELRAAMLELKASLGL